MTRIVHTFEPATHGVPNYVAFLAQHQAAAGHDVHVVGPARRDLPGVTWLDRATDRNSPRSIRRVGRWVADYASSIDADVVHAHSFFAGLGIRTARPTQPVFYTPHAWAFAAEGAQRLPAIATERALLGRTAQVLCVSEGAAADGRAVLGEDAPIVSVGSAIDLDRFRRVPTTDAQQAYAPYAVCIGRISEQKGQLRLAELWERQMGGSGLNLVFVGDRHPEESTRSYPISSQNVHFVGASSDVAEWLSGAVFAVQPSRWEAMSLATAEALACETAVIATDVAGMREAITDGPLPMAGAVVQSIEAIIGAARQRFQTPTLRAREAMATRERAEQLFSAERLVAAVEAQYALHLDTTLNIDELEPVVIVRPDAETIDLDASEEVAA